MFKQVLKSRLGETQLCGTVNRVDLVAEGRFASSCRRAVTGPAVLQAEKSRIEALRLQAMQSMQQRSAR